MPSNEVLRGFSEPTSFSNVSWAVVPDAPGVYVIFDREEIVYVGMAGREGKGSLRKRLRDHSTGQVVNMFAQYLFLARVQFMHEPRIAHPVAAKAACQAYIRERCSFRCLATENAADARSMELRLRQVLSPTLNGSAAKSAA
jgi:hypothetical protein